VRLAARGWLDDLGEGQNVSRTEPSQTPLRLSARVGRCIALFCLVGSPRTRKSSSQALGGYLFDRLAESRVQTETFYIHTSLYSPERMQALMDAVDAADLVMLAFPLYGRQPAGSGRGYPGTDRRPAKREMRGRGALCRPGQLWLPGGRSQPHCPGNLPDIRPQAGFGWAGALALGAGEGLVHGAPLAQAGGPAIPIRKRSTWQLQHWRRGKPFRKARLTCWPNRSSPVGHTALW